MCWLAQRILCSKVPCSTATCDVRHAVLWRRADISLSSQSASILSSLFTVSWPAGYKKGRIRFERLKTLSSNEYLLVWDWSSMLVSMSY